MGHSNKSALIGLVVVFVAPLLLAMMFFQWTLYSGQAKTSNYGTLISPMKDITAPLSLKQKLDGKWSLVFIEPQCSDHCAQRLKMAETVRVLTNEQMRRVQTIFVSTEALDERYVPDHIAAPKINTLIFSPVQLQALKEQLQYRQSTIILVDPLGRGMMQYDIEQSEVKRIVRDLNRLLKYSRIG